MKKGKLSLMLLLVLVLSLSLAASSYSQPRGRGFGGMNLTPEQAGQLFDLKQKFMNDTAGLRKEMMIKRTEMAAIWRADTPDEKLILGKQKEINALRDQLQEKRVAFRMQARKICPQGKGRMGMGPGDAMGPGGGMGPGAGMDPGEGCGMGMAMGPGGMGPGGNW